MFCREQVARFSGELGAVRAAGGEVHAVGNGSASMAKDFVAQFDVQFPVWTDPSRKTYELAGMQAGILKTFSPASAVRSVGVLRSGFRQGPVRGDPWQQGGVLVVGTDGQLLMHHVDRSAGDHGDPAAALAALRAAS